MRRRLITIAIFVLAGAVVNVAVAWGCAGWSRDTGARFGSMERENALWADQRPPISLRPRSSTRNTIMVLDATVRTWAQGIAR